MKALCPAMALFCLMLPACEKKAERMAVEETRDPRTHASFAADDNGMQVITVVGGVHLGRLLLDGLFYQEHSQVPAEARAQPEILRRLFKALVDLGLDHEVTQWYSAVAFEVADLARQVETLTDEVENPPV